MTNQFDRKEPVLEETLEDNDDTPLLLTKLVREGLPPQLWRHEESSSMHEPNSETDKTQALLRTENADKFSMQWEEAESESAASAVTEQTKMYTQSEARWQPTESTNPQTDFEDRDLEAALKRMRQGLSQFTASRSEPLTSEHLINKKNDTDSADQPVIGLVSEHLKPAPANPESAEAPISADADTREAPLPAAVESEFIINEPVEINPEPAEVPVDEATVEAARTEPETAIADAAIVPSVEEHKEFVEEHSVPEPEPSPVQDKTPLDLDFLKDFEQLLFQEIERRVINEMEEQMTQHLQKVWKEQVSLTIMRTLALEGIKLRESLAQEMRASLPEILQRVLHNGLEQITPTEPD